jgi:hypothetical protein
MFKACAAAQAFLLCTCSGKEKAGDKPAFCMNYI